MAKVCKALRAAFQGERARIQAPNLSFGRCIYDSVRSGATTTPTVVLPHRFWFGGVVVTRGWDDGLPGVNEKGQDPCPRAGGTFLLVMVSGSFARVALRADDRPQRPARAGRRERERLQCGRRRRRSARRAQSPRRWLAACSGLRRAPVRLRSALPCAHDRVAAC